MKTQSNKVLLHGSLFAVAIATAAMSGTAQAHHSAAMFDETKCIALSGTVRTLQLTYPHSWLWMVVPNSKGTEDIWGFEGADPATLRVSGWTKTTLKPGDKISVIFKPLRDGRNGGSLHRVTFPDGHVFVNKISTCPDKVNGKSTRDIAPHT